MNVLAIGNSFSEDATRYLHQIARADGENVQVVSLYIGGCSLERHYRNMLSGERAYELQYNGQKTGFPVSLSEALLNRKWDVVTIQQQSSSSANVQTFRPYTDEIAAFVRKCVPTAKIYMHQTWAYEDGSDMLFNFAKYPTASDMLRDIVASYATIAQEIKADGIIPCGEVMASLLANGISKVHRDTFHASFGLGRYALALTWYRTLTGRSVKDNSFSDFDEAIAPVDVETVKECVDQTVAPYIK